MDVVDEVVLFVLFVLLLPDKGVVLELLLVIFVLFVRPFLFVLGVLLRPILCEEEVDVVVDGFEGFEYEAEVGVVRFVRLLNIFS